MPKPVLLSDKIGFARAGADAHMLGISRADELLRESGFTSVVADAIVCNAFDNPAKADRSSLIRNWLSENRVTILCFSYRLDPDDAVLIFRKLMYQLDLHGIFEKSGGLVRGLYFAGLPEACDQIHHIFAGEVGVFRGDETPTETLSILGIDPALAPTDITGEHPYDVVLQDFGRSIIAGGEYAGISAVDRHTSKFYGTRHEQLVDRIHHGRNNQLPPLIRVHAGPYGPDRLDAVKLFESWCKELVNGGLLDILSIGTSQLTQERFGENWDGRPNGGGVPINSPDEYERIWKASRPMLVRTYAGTQRLSELVKVHEDSMNIAWHALSLWWFCRIDGRGPNSLYENLQEQFEALSVIASTGKPYEPNIPHHFAFRGSDDISYIVSAVLAARVAKRMGIHDLIVQIMLNVPKATWGINDLAKARAVLILVRALEDANFRIFLQTRAGLNYLSYKPQKAKEQLAAVTALMDDIEPNKPTSPDIVHVVSYSEGSHLATPEIINESIRISRYALVEYRRLRLKGDVDDMSEHPDVRERLAFLLEGSRDVLMAIEDCVKDPYTPRGLHDIFRLGFLPVPQLMNCRDEFPEAVKWETRIRNGRVEVFQDDKPLPPKQRMEIIKEELS